MLRLEHCQLESDGREVHDCSFAQSGACNLGLSRTDTVSLSPKRTSYVSVD